MLNKESSLFWIILWLGPLQYQIKCIYLFRVPILLILLFFTFCVTYIWRRLSPRADDLCLFSIIFRDCVKQWLYNINCLINNVLSSCVRALSEILNVLLGLLCWKITIWNYYKSRVTRNKNRGLNHKESVTASGYIQSPLNYQRS